MVVIVVERRPFDEGLVHRRAFRVGDSESGKLETIEDLEQAIEKIQQATFPRIRNNAYWFLRRIIVDPESGEPVCVGQVGTFRVFGLGAFRELGVNLLQEAIQTLETGALGYGIGSDPDIELTDEDLGYLHDAFENETTRGWFSLVGIIG